jgi:sister-chromatid-cohesion protein PDS5
MKTIIDLVDKNDSEEKLNAQIMFVSRHLFEVNKAQELMKALVKLFKDNLNLKSYFKSLVNPNCSCAKAMELISLILSNLANGLTATNLNMAKSLIERMSSIIFDDDTLSALFDIIDLKIFESKPESTTSDLD